MKDEIVLGSITFMKMPDGRVRINAFGKGDLMGGAFYINHDLADDLLKTREFVGREAKWILSGRRQ